MNIATDSIFVSLTEVVTPACVLYFIITPKIHIVQKIKEMEVFVPELAIIDAFQLVNPINANTASVM